MLHRWFVAAEYRWRAGDSSAADGGQLGSRRRGRLGGGRVGGHGFGDPRLGRSGAWDRRRYRGDVVTWVAVGTGARPLALPEWIQLGESPGGESSLGPEVSSRNGTRHLGSSLTVGLPRGVVVGLVEPFAFSEAA